MVEYTTSWTRGEIYNPGLKYGERKNLTMRECKEQIDILNIDVHSMVNKDSMKELIDKIYKNIKEIIVSCRKLGITINLGSKSIRQIVVAGDDIDKLKKSILKQYISRIEVPKTISRSKSRKQSSVM